MVASQASLDLKTTCINMVLAWHPLTAKAVHDFVVRKESAELELIGIQQLSNLPKAFATGVSSNVTLNKRNSRLLVLNHLCLLRQRLLCDKQLLQHFNFIIRVITKLVDRL